MFQAGQQNFKLKNGCLSGLDLNNIAFPEPRLHFQMFVQTVKGERLGIIEHDQDVEVAVPQREVDGVGTVKMELPFRLQLQRTYGLFDCLYANLAVFVGRLAANAVAAPVSRKECISLLAILQL